MNKLLLYKKEKKIMSPFCEITFNLENNADMDDFIESLKYWGVEYRDMDNEYNITMQKFENKKHELREGEIRCAHCNSFISKAAF